MPEAVFGIVVVVGALLWLLLRMTILTAAGQSVGRRDRQELRDLRNLVDDLKETAWDHRELDSALATIIIDKIRTYERQRRDS